MAMKPKKPMPRHSRRLAVLVVIAAALLPAAAAQAQYYAAAAPPPLYPYAVPQRQPYAVQVAPNTYVIHRPAAAAPRLRRCVTAAPPPISVHRARRIDRAHKQVDRALVEELRKRSERKEAAVEAKKDAVGDSVNKRTVYKTKKIVRDRPVVIVHKRYVDDPPRVIDRAVAVEDAPRTDCNRGLMTRCDTVTAPVVSAPAPAPFVRLGRAAGKRRVIDADAEITILGPDRMNIRLYRKRTSARRQRR